MNNDDAFLKELMNTKRSMQDILLQKYLFKFPNPLDAGDYNTNLNPIFKSIQDNTNYDIQGIVFFGSACRLDRIYKSHTLNYNFFGFKRKKMITKRVAYPNDLDILFIVNDNDGIKNTKIPLVQKIKTAGYDVYYDDDRVKIDFADCFFLTDKQYEEQLNKGDSMITNINNKGIVLFNNSTIKLNSKKQFVPVKGTYMVMHNNFSS